MPFLYGQSDTKFVKGPEDERRQKIKPLDTYQFKLCPLLEGKIPLKRNEASIRYRVTPDTLVELCLPIVNAIPLPQPQKWSTHQVIDWIRNLGFPEYQRTFRKNHINGRTLLRMDASYLAKINIHKFEDIQTITESIQRIYGFDKSKFGRSVSLPQRQPGAAYKFFRTKSGAYYDATRRTDLYRMRHQLREKPLYETHWQTLERWLKHRRPLETELIGGTIRKKYNLYYPQKEKSKPASISKHMKGCDCAPPCICQWTAEKEFRQPWNLKCLNKPGIKKALTSTLHSCRCTPPCVCDWSKTPRETLPILKTYLPDKYDVHNKKRFVRKSYKIYIGEGEQSETNQTGENFVNPI